MTDRSINTQRCLAVGLGMCAGISFSGVALPMATAATPVSFANVTELATADSPRTVAVGDLTGDGFLDMVTSNGSPSNSVSVLIGDGNGGFGPQTEFPAGADSVDLALGDVNGDGDLDVVTANNDSANVSVLLGDGEGGLSAPTDFAVLAGLTSVALGDVNGDGDLDIVTCNKYIQNEAAAGMSVLLGNGDGTFGSSTNYPISSTPQSVVLGDVSDDGNLDAVLSSDVGGKVFVVLGDGMGGFGAATEFPAQYGTNDSALGDLNSDGDLDIVTANSGSDTLSVLIGNGHGAFANPTQFGAAPSPKAVALGDVNGDGDVDAVSANADGNNMSVLLGNGSGGLGSKSDFDIGSHAYSAALGDLNGDGKLDIASSSSPANSAYVLLNKTAYTPTNSVTPASGSTAGGTQVDINGTNFTGANSVRFAGVNATSFSVVSDTRISAIAPAGSSGAVTVKVATPLVSVSTPKAYTYIGKTQRPLNNCVVVPKRIPASGTTRLLKPHCKTNAGQKVRVAVSGSLDNRGDVRTYKVIRKKNGKTLIRTYGEPLNLKVVWRASATSTYKKFQKTHRYNT